MVRRLACWTRWRIPGEEVLEDQLEHTGHVVCGKELRFHSRCSKKTPQILTLQSLVGRTVVKRITRLPQAV